METKEPVHKIILVTDSSGVECVQRGLQEIEPWTNVLNVKILTTLSNGAIIFHDRESE